MHSAHVPLTILIIEVLLSPPGYFAEPDPYLLLCAGILQAWVMKGLASMAVSVPSCAISQDRLPFLG